MIDRAALLSVVEDAQRSQQYPAGAQVLDGKCQGDFEFEPAVFAGVVRALSERSIPFSELLPPDDYPQSHYRGYETFLRSLLAARACTPASSRDLIESNAALPKLTEWSAERVDVSGDLVLPKYATLITEGELRVGGDLVLQDGSVFVALSHVTVDGDWVAESEWCQATASNDVAVAGAAILAGETFVGGKLSAPLVYTKVIDCMGQLKVLGGVHTRVLLEDEREGAAFSEIHGESSIGLALPEDIVIGAWPVTAPIHEDRRWKAEASRHRPDTSALLPQAVAGSLLDARALRDALSARVRARLPILVGDPSHGWLFGSRSGDERQ